MSAESHAATAPSPASEPRRSKYVAVWDPVVRIFHWLVVAGYFANMFITEEGKAVHRWIGYAVIGAVLLRLIWGFIGTKHARFSDFIPTPSRLWRYVTSLLRGREPRYIGHNPAAALMIVALMSMLLLCGVTGWMQGLDAFWGVEWVQDLHETAANLILVLVGIHVAAAIIESLRHRENLVRSMITGRKRTASGSDIDHASSSR